MKRLLPLLIITFLLYLAITYVSSSVSNFDTKSYAEIGALTLAGKSIYPDPAISRHPYLPFFLYFEAGALAVSQFLKIPQIILIKIVLSFFHLLSVYALYVLSRKNIKMTLLYALNPISLFIIAFHGQFDIIPLTCILFAIIALQNKRFIKTVLLLAAAVTIKTWPILFVLPFLKRIPRKFWPLFVILPLFFLFLYPLLFHTSLFSIARVLLVYQGVGGVWGLGKVFSLISASKIVLLIYKVIFVMGILIYSFRQKKTLIIEELLKLFLLFFIFTPGFGIQWFLWFVPFLILSKNPFARLLLIPITLCVGVVYLSWLFFFPLSNIIISSVFFITWIFFIGCLRAKL